MNSSKPRLKQPGVAVIAVSTLKARSHRMRCGAVRHVASSFFAAYRYNKTPHRTATQRIWCERTFRRHQWDPGLLFTIMCVRTHKFLSYDCSGRAYIYARIYDFSYVRKFRESRYARKNLRTQNLRTETGVRTFVNSTPEAPHCTQICFDVTRLL